jgi:uncharacterized protein (DUF1499 family)
MEIDDLLKSNIIEPINHVQIEDNEYQKLKNIYTQNIRILSNLKNITEQSKIVRTSIKSKIINLSNDIIKLKLEANDIVTSYTNIINNMQYI